MAPRLKVFVTSDGLTDYVVAVSSKAKALEAWGSHQDLFKTGLAHETDDPRLVTAAAARPGAVLRRPAGSRSELAKMKPARPAKPAGPSKAALKKVADLEKKLAGLAREQAQALAHLDGQRAALEARIERLKATQAAAREKLEAELSAARQAPG